jgi:hypothetical protein
VIFKNVAGQGIYFAAFNGDGEAVAADQANITATISKDGAAPGATATANPTNIGGGGYWLPLSQAETNANQFMVIPVSATAGVTIDPVIVSTTGGAIPLVAFGASGGLSIVGSAMTLAADAVNANALATDAANEIRTGLSTLDAAGVRTAIGLASANLDAQLGAIDDLLDTEVAAILARLPVRPTKNTALANFPFLMVDSTDHVTGETGLTVTATRSIDGGAFAACANAVTEVANGLYKINLAASDLNGDTIVLRFTATDADPRVILVVPQP